jgi:serine/threonine protein phosphatase PrpC
MPVATTVVVSSEPSVTDMGSPVKAQVVSGSDMQWCRTILGPKFDANARDAQAAILNSPDSVQIQLDKPLSAPWKLSGALITSTASLLTGLLGLITLMGRRPVPKKIASVPNPGPGEPSPSIPPPDRDADGLAVPTARPVELASLTASGISGLTVDRGTSGQFDVYAATQVGLQHANKGGTREDAYAVGGSPESGWVFLAVADGLGGAQDSHAAAQIASRWAVRQLLERLPRLDARSVAEQWRSLAADVVASVSEELTPAAIGQWADELGYLAPQKRQESKPSAPATTLVFAALGPVDETGYDVLWAAVGDSDAMLIDVDSGQITWLTENATKQPGGLISNVTHALPRDARQLQVGGAPVSANTMTILATDGLADAIRLEARQFAELLPQIARSSPAEWRFGELVGFNLPGLHDDRTIAAAWPRIAPRTRGNRR